MGLTTDPNDPRLGRGVDDAPIAQHEVYLVLSEDERARGFVRPLRRSYIHVGPAGPRFATRELDAEQRSGHLDETYVAFEPYPEEMAPAIGRYWSQAQLDAVGKGCGSETTMGLALCETYAREPHFYGATYCCSCAKHLPVAEFTWAEDGQRVGT